jgi:hypothetical protein
MVALSLIPISQKITLRLQRKFRLLFIYSGWFESLKANTVVITAPITVIPAFGCRGELVNELMG